MRDLRDSPEFTRGAAGEKRVSAWLQEKGWHVIPSYDYAGSDGNKAPKLQGFSVGYPVPDLDVARKGIRRWVEVKVKSYSPTYWKGGYKVHGIELRLLQHYQTVEKITGTECWIAVYQEDTRELWCQSIAKLGEPQIGTDRGSKMAYWPRDRFQCLHTFSREEV